MCVVCRKIQSRLAQHAPLTPAETKGFVSAIGKKVEDGADYMHFEEVLNEVLGTTVPDSNLELDQAWEATRKRG